MVMDYFPPWKNIGIMITPRKIIGNMIYDLVVWLINNLFQPIRAHLKSYSYCWSKSWAYVVVKSTISIYFWHKKNITLCKWHYFQSKTTFISWKKVVVFPRYSIIYFWHEKTRSNGMLSGFPFSIHIGRENSFFYFVAYIYILSLLFIFLFWYYFLSTCAIFPNLCVTLENQNLSRECLHAYLCFFPCALCDLDKS